MGPLLTVTGLECVWWLAAGEEENDHENREQQSHRAHRTHQESTARLGKGTAPQGSPGWRGERSEGVGRMRPR